MPTRLAGLTRGSVIALAIAAAVTGAGAADASPLSPFEGPYIGLQAGYGITTVEVDAEIAGFGITEEFDEGGFNGGVFLGYSAVAGRLFGGVEFDASLSTAEYDDSVNGIELEAEQQFTLGASGLIGYLIQDNLLLYTRLGYVYSEFEARASDGVSSVRESQGFHGFRAGAGADLAVGERISVRGEYSYTLYKSERFSDGVASVSFEPWEHLARVGVAYRF